MNEINKSNFDIFKRKKEYSFNKECSHKKKYLFQF